MPGLGVAPGDLLQVLRAGFVLCALCFVQVFGCRHRQSNHALWRPASEKRQGTKSRGVGHWLEASAHHGGEAKTG